MIDGFNDGCGNFSDDIVVCDSVDVCNKSVDNFCCNLLVVCKVVIDSCGKLLNDDGKTPEDERDKMLDDDI